MEVGLSAPALIFLCLTFLSSVGCVRSVEKSVRPPSQGTELGTAFVYPFGFRWAEPAYRSFELSQRLVELGVRTVGDRVAWYGPSEFIVKSPRDNNAWLSTNALPILLQGGGQPETAIIVRPWAEEFRMQAAATAADTKDRLRAASMQSEVRYRGHIELVHPSTAEVLVELEGDALSRPFDADEMAEQDFDPAPALTHLMERLLVDALREAQPWLRGPSAAPGVDWVGGLTPVTSLGFAVEGQVGGSDFLASLDEIDREVLGAARARFAMPGLSSDSAAAVAKMGQGFYVTAPCAGGRLSAGDLIVDLGGRPALPQVMARQRFSGAPTLATVVRPNGERTQVMLP